MPDASLTKRLFELQELELIIAESRILHRGEEIGRIRDLCEKARQIREGVPAEHLRRYDQLLRKGQAVARLEAGVCMACRLNVPQGELIRMRKGEVPQVCPNCGRFVVFEDAS